MKKLLWALTLGLILAGCGPDPVKIEKAGAIRRESEALYLATATHVAIQADFASIQARATATAIADIEQVRVATQDDRIARQKNVIWWSTVAAIIFILAVVTAFSVVGIGGAAAANQQMQLRSKLIHLSKDTRTWPVLVDLKSGWLTDLETGERARLDSIQALDHRRLIISGQARVTGLLAQSAERIAKDTKNVQPGDMLPAIGTSVPMLREKDCGR